MEEYYLVLKYKSLLDKYNDSVYQLSINHNAKTVTCDTNHYHFDMMIDYKYNK